MLSQVLVVKKQAFWVVACVLVPFIWLDRCSKLGKRNVVVLVQQLCFIYLLHSLSCHTRLCHSPSRMNIWGRSSAQKVQRIPQEKHIRTWRILIFIWKARPIRSHWFFVFQLPTTKDLHVRLAHLLIVLLLLLVIFFFIPSAIFSALEPAWNYTDSLYYCFISLTTIG